MQRARTSNGSTARQPLLGDWPGPDSLPSCCIDNSGRDILHGSVLTRPCTRLMPAQHCSKRPRRRSQNLLKPPVKLVNLTTNNPIFLTPYSPSTLRDRRKILLTTEIGSSSDKLYLFKSKSKSRTTWNPLQSRQGGRASCWETSYIARRLKN